MRLSIGAILTTGAALASAMAIPPTNQTNSTVATEDQETIPITHIVCTGYDLNPELITKAKHQLAHWGINHKVHGKAVKRSRVEDTFWYVCNCKWIWKDGLALSELEEAEKALYNECGFYRSGYVWSHKWDKFYGLEVKDYLKTLPREWMGCPRGCVVQEDDRFVASSTNSTES